MLKARSRTAIDGKEKNKLVSLGGRMGEKRKLLLSLPNFKILPDLGGKGKEPHLILNQILTLIISWERIFLLLDCDYVLRLKLTNHWFCWGGFQVFI